MPNSMIRNVLCGISVAGLLTLGIISQANSTTPSNSPQAQSEKQTQQPTKSVAGKVATIGNGGTSFTLEVTGGNTNKHTSGQNPLHFVVDNHTQGKGHVKQGTDVTLAYQAMENSQPFALSLNAPAS